MGIKIKKILIALTYLFLLAGCIWIVHMVRKAADMSTLEESIYSGESQAEGIKDTLETEGDTKRETEIQKVESEEESQKELKESRFAGGGYEDSQTQHQEGDFKETLPEIKRTPPSIILATDVHHLSPEMKDDGQALKKAVNKDDGKMIHYSDWILEAFLDEVIEQNPTALVLSGDLTVNGEKENHEDLAKRLKRVKEAGIQVLVIPGNHDINNPHAKVLKGEESKPAASVTAEEFYEIYQEYGYTDALSQDEHSLSYLYQLDEKNWLLMLDTCQYDPVNLVSGRIREETLIWLREQLLLAAEKEVQVIPIAHHNLLNQSRLFTTECTILNDKEAVELFEEFQVPLFLSGHLHLQRIKKHTREPGTPTGTFGIQEVITSSLIMPPCQYGVLQWGEHGSLTYRSETVDVERYAKAQGSTDENLLYFSEYSTELMSEIIAGQKNNKLSNLPEEHTQFMTGIYASVYYDYCRGKAIDGYEVKQTRGYQFWERNLPDHRLVEEITEMIKDSGEDSFYWEGSFGS